MGCMVITDLQLRPLDAVPALTNFLNRRSLQNARNQNRSKLGPGELQALSKELNNSGRVKPMDADTTKSNLCVVMRKWVRYCNYIGWEDWRGALKNYNKGDVMAFLHYICENDRVNSKDSVHQYLKQFKMLLSRANGEKMDTNDGTDAYEYLRTTLVPKFGLSIIPKPKPVLGSNDLLLLLTHHWARDTCTFPTEDQRVQFATILLFSSYTACRPAEVVDGSKNTNRRQISWDDPNNAELEDLNYEGQDPTQSEDPDYGKLVPWESQDNNSFNDDDGLSDFNVLVRLYKAICYEDVRLWIVQNPKQRERDLLAMEVTLSHHKGVDKKPKPTTFLFREETLPIFCPISHFIALAIRDNTFKVDGLQNLQSAEPFFTTKLKNPMKAMLIHWKPSMLKIPIFRQAVRTAEGFQTSKWKCLPYSIYAYYLDRLGWETGLPERLIHYVIRRGTANSVDGATTIAVRDQVMRHDPKTGIFSGSYLNEKVRFDVQAAFLDRPSMDGLTKAFTHISLTCDPRAPKHVPQEVMDALPPDPVIVELETARSELYDVIRKKYQFIKQARGTKIGNIYQKLGAKLASAKKKRTEDIKKQYRRDYHDRIHDEEMEKHLNGVATEDYVEPMVQHQLLERTQVQEVMCDFSEDLTTEEIVRRRVHAIDRMVALCSRREVPQPKQRLPAFFQGSIKEVSPEPRFLDPTLFPLVCEKTQCPICIGDDRLPYSSRMFCYKRTSHMMDHVERAHIRKMPPGQQILCHHPVCKIEKVVLDDIECFKTHVAKTHKISLRDLN